MIISAITGRNIETFNTEPKFEVWGRYELNHYYTVSWLEQVVPRSGEEFFAN